MGRYIKQNESRTELQQRIAAELRAKAEAKSRQENMGPDGVNDSAYIEGTKQTTSLAWAWLLIFFMVIGVLIFIIVRANS